MLTSQVDTEEERIARRALAQVIGAREALAYEVEDSSGIYGFGITFSDGSTKYAVLTDEEADSAWDEALDSYLEECVLPDVEECFRRYFDEEKWKEDARHDGRAQAINSYDGNEHEAQVDGTWLYVYRVN